MSSYDHITNEEELQKLMSETESFDEKKKIRSRIRALHEEQRSQYESKRREIEQENEKAMRKKYEIADQEKQRKMEVYKNAKPTGETATSSLASGLDGMKKMADDDKQKKLAGYSKVAGAKGGTKSAMASFKQMDQSTAAAKPGGGGLKPGVSRSPSSIKQVLLDWTKAMTREYENVEITNFSSSWNNGMAFCALIHHFYPDSFDFSKLDPKKRRGNFTLAFAKAEELADIAPLLEVDDMVKMKNPDWKCVFTYVQSFYRKLRDHERNKAAPAALPKTVEQ